MNRPSAHRLDTRMGALNYQVMSSPKMGNVHQREYAVTNETHSDIVHWQHFAGDPVDISVDNDGPAASSSRFPHPHTVQHQVQGHLITY